MSGLQINRRTFMLGASAAAVVAAAPVAIPFAAEATATTKAVAPDGSWGYSLNGDEWRTGFMSREDAIAEAADYGAERYSTSYCTTIPFSYPDAESAAQWMDDPNWSLGDHLAEDFLSCNEDCDWEGGFFDAVGMAPTADMDAAARQAVAAALVRHGRPDEAAAVLMWTVKERGEPIIEYGDLLLAIERDETLTADLKAVVRAWVDEHDIENSPRCLNTRDEQEHSAPESASA